MVIFLTNRLTLELDMLTILPQLFLIIGILTDFLELTDDGLNAL